MDKKAMGVAIVLNKFFKRPGDTVKSFKEELEQLSEEEKIELARLAAIELGLTQAEVSFPLAVSNTESLAA
jgi:hypothetical protein